MKPANQGQGGGPALREALLRRELLKQDSPAAPDGVCAALMDWHVGNGVATLVAYADGAVSLYFSTGGGIIGAGTHETVREAGQRFFQLVTDHLPSLDATDDVSLPSQSQAGFWAVTRHRTFSSGPIPIENLVSGSHTLAEAGMAAQMTITAIRQTGKVPD